MIGSCRDAFSVQRMRLGCGCWIGRCIVVESGSSERCEQSVRVRVEGQRSLDHELRLVLCNEAGLYWSSTAERQRGRVRAVLALTNAKMAYASEPLLCSRCQYEPTGAREREGAGPAECERRSGARRCHHTPAAAHAAHPIESRRVVAAREWRSSTRATRAAPEGGRSRLGLLPGSREAGLLPPSTFASGHLSGSRASAHLRPSRSHLLRWLPRPCSTRFGAAGVRPSRYRGPPSAVRRCPSVGRRGSAICAGAHGEKVGQ